MFSRTTTMIASVALVAGFATVSATRTGVTAATSDDAPALQSIGPMTFGPGGVLFAAADFHPEAEPGIGHEIAVVAMAGAARLVRVVPELRALLPAVALRSTRR